MAKDYKPNCGFRKYLKVCKFSVEQCRPPKDGDVYGDCCHLYPLEWDVKFLKKHGKLMTEDMMRLEKSLKQLKQTDKEKYKETKKIIKDHFNGLVILGKAVLFIKRSGGGSLNKQEKKVADKLMKKIKDGKQNKEGL